MDAVIVSARFAAYHWSKDHNAGNPAAEELAARFASRNWPAFLPYAHTGLGRLLLRIAGARRRGGSRRPQIRRRGCPAAPAAVD
jgi:hypothetical protein